MKLSIGQVSKIFGISKDTLRYYDKIGILTPEVNENNGYRYYLLKHIEKLGLIVGIKYLGISLSNIKNTIESENINEYKNLIIKQEEIINKKIKELKELEKNLDNSKKIINNILNFNNEYDFTKLKVTNDNFNLYGIDMKIILNTDFYNNHDEIAAKELTDLNKEAYFYAYNIIKNKYIEEDDNLVFIKENDKIIDLIKKYSNEDNINLKRKTINGKVISTNFYGTPKEINHYILLLNKYFKCPETNIAYVKYEFYLPKKNDNVMYFVNIVLEI